MFFYTGVIMPKKTEKPLHGFEEDMHRLEEIVQKLEAGVLIEEAIVLYEEGVKLAGKLETRLSDIERRVFEVKNVSKLASGDDKELNLGLFE
jgi:exodeoxyribonuclease VII small subunit